MLEIAAIDDQAGPLRALVQFGFALAAALIVAGAFLLLSWIWGQMPAHRALGAFGRLLRRVDEFLVRRVARLFGTWERKRLARWARLLGLLTASGVLGAVAPGGLGLAILGFGLFGAVGVYRHWSWDEADRAAGVAPEKRQAPVAQDLANEGMAAVAAFVMLLVLVVFKLAAQRLFITDSGAGYSGYVLYVLKDLTASLPIFDALELYGVGIAPGVRPEPPAGLHVAFLLRVAVDLMVIAAGLKLIEISVRMTRGDDLRRQEAAVLSGAEERMREAIAYLERRALTGQANAQVLLERVAMPPLAERPAYRLEARHRAAGALIALGEDPERGLGMLQVARDTLVELTARFEAANQPSAWAHAQADLGAVNLNIAGRLLGRARSEALKSALEAFYAALEWFEAQDDRAATLRLEHLSANALAKQAELEDPAEAPALGRRAAELADAMYERAFNSANAAKDTATALAVVSAWGAALRKEGERAAPDGRAAPYRNAIKLHRAALKMDPEDVFAETNENRINLAAALCSRVTRMAPDLDEAARRACVEELDEAEGHYRDGAERLARAGERTAAMRIRVDIAALLSLKARFVSGQAMTEALGKAIDDLLAALDWFRRDRWPFDWAKLQDNLGIAYGMRASGLPSGPARADLLEAEQCHLRALEVFNVAMAPNEARMAEANLGVSRRALARLSGQDQD